jgi:hypothetical protein
VPAGSKAQAHDEYKMQNLISNAEHGYDRLKLHTFNYHSFLGTVKLDNMFGEKVPKNYKIDCAIRLDGEYELMYVPRTARVRLQEEASTDVQKAQLYSSTFSEDYSFSKAVVAVFQTVYSSMTLYRARADQLSRYGYAAFGLTVAPYTIMSVINLIGSALTPHYPALHLINSKLVQEATSRGNKLEAVTDSFLKLDASLDTWTGSFESIDPEQNSYIMKFTPNDKHNKHNILRARVNISPDVDEDKAFFTQFNVQKSSYLSDEDYSALHTLITILITAAPIATVGAISRFAPGESTTSERGWTMSWLVFGIVLGFLMRGWTHYFLQNLGRNRAIEITQLVSGVVLYSVPAIGGVVAVVQMYLDFGVCTRFD